MRIIKILLCIIICLALIGCAPEEEPSPDITEYLARFVAMDYAGMYVLSSPTVDITQDTFVKKYEDIFSGLGISQVTLNRLAGPDSAGTFAATVTYSTEHYGDFSNVFEIKTGFIDERFMVLWDYSLIFPEMGEGYSVRVQTLHASRGEIFAADGSLLAANTFAQTLFMDTSKIQDISAVADVVLPLTDLTNTQIVDMLAQSLEKGESIVVLGTYLAGELTEEDKEAVLGVPGLGIDDKMYTPIRDYPMGEVCAHMIGYTGFYSEEDLPEGYTEADKAGLSGLEAAYETMLRGADGKIAFIEDKWGRSVRTLYHDPVSEGQDLRLTVAPDMQRRAYEALDTLLEGDETGAAIVLDASTGYIEAMVSYPSFDNNLFTFGLSEKTWKYFNAPESNRPLFARTTQGLYPPGSVFKPFTASAALQEGAISKSTEFDGEIIDNQWLPDMRGWFWKPITRVDDSGSPLVLYNALTYSDNIYFAFAALRLGSDDFMAYMEQIGMEEAVPFDLPVKAASLVKSTSTIDLRLLADMGYGQGELLMSPLQLASMYTAFANGSGDMLQPILVQKICQTQDLEYVTIAQNERTVWVDDAISDNSMDVLLPILYDVVQRGTGRPVRIPGVRIAGKTGTAEIGDDKSREISWFAGYWEDGNYDRLVVVMVDTAAEEGPVKFDIAKALLTP